MAPPPGPFPYDPDFAEKQASGVGILEIPSDPLPEPAPDPATEPETFGDESFGDESFGND